MLRHSFLKCLSTEHHHYFCALFSFMQVKGVKFDYIEYNGGMSRSASYLKDLGSLEGILATDGVIGVTALAANKHVRDIQALLQSRNTSVHKPFSEEAARLVRQYFKTNGLNIRASDDDELTFLLSGVIRTFSKVVFYSLFIFKARFVKK